MNKTRRKDKRGPQRPPAAAKPTPPQEAPPTLLDSARSHRDQLHLVPRDGALAWAWWEITAASYERARAQLARLSADVELVIQLRSGGFGDFARRGVLELPVTAWLGELALPLGAPGAPHFASIGLRARSGAPCFAAIARSNVLIPPPLTPSPRAEAPRWAEVRLPSAESPA